MVGVNAFRSTAMVGCLCRPQLGRWAARLQRLAAKVHLHRRDIATSAGVSESLLKDAKFVEFVRQLTTCDLKERVRVAENNGHPLDMSTPVINDCIRSLQSLAKDKRDLEALVRDGDEGMASLAQDELAQNRKLRQDEEAQLLDLLLPVDGIANSDIALEVTAGVGGQEAMLFAADIFNMYLNFIQRINSTVVSLSTDKSDLGGLRHGKIVASGGQIYLRMKFEGGIHRVQRVPKTEKAGRIHTSTVAVAVLPQPPEIAVSIHPKDLKIETTRSSGAGGQHVNTTNSAVRMVHLPTGLVVENQTERSQLRNKEMALQRLRGLLYERQLDEQVAKQKQRRKLQVGSSARSEKIRTYNFPQDRVTDHRIGVTVHNLPEFLEGGSPLEKMLHEVWQFGRREALYEAIDSFFANSSTQS